MMILDWRGKSQLVEAGLSFLPVAPGGVQVCTNTSVARHFPVVAGQCGRNFGMRNNNLFFWIWYKHLWGYLSDRFIR
ncbi:MAG: hypothetical protein C4516_11045 [Oxalobacter sp.]|nr:MAG: hypothetical protein C4516_11045 [Oxalobacter sp.]